MIPYGKQDIRQEDIDAVVEVLHSDFITQGPQVPRFERQVADLVGARHALAMNSATSALHVACLGLGLGAGDILWTSPITFVASANCGLYCGASVDFVDIDPRTYNLCPKALEEKLRHAEVNDSLPKVVVVVHLSGQSCDMAAVRRLSQQFGFRVIEDASHAIGGKYRGQYIGGGQYSDITVFSFHPVKIVTTAEGGMALTNDDELASRMALLRSHGITRDEALMEGASHGDWYYQQIALGFNYRMTELQAALGISQVKRLDEYVARRHQIARLYDQLLGELPLRLPWQHPDSYSAYHLYIVRLDLAATTSTHRQVFERLRERGVGVNLHYIPVYQQPYYKRLGVDVLCQEAERYYAEAISLPMYPGLTDDEQRQVVEALKESLS